MIIAKIETFPLSIPFKSSGCSRSVGGQRPAGGRFAAGQGDNRSGIGRLGRGFRFSRGAVGQVGDQGADRTALH
jgi:hypothetical protein